jgi:hypothetical protein
MTQFGSRASCVTCTSIRTLLPTGKHQRAPRIQTVRESGRHALRADFVRIVWRLQGVWSTARKLSNKVLEWWPHLFRSREYSGQILLRLPQPLNRPLDPLVNGPPVEILLPADPLERDALDHVVLK